MTDTSKHLPKRPPPPPPPPPLPVGEEASTPARLSRASTTSPVPMRAPPPAPTASGGAEPSSTGTPPESSNAQLPPAPTRARSNTSPQPQVPVTLGLDADKAQKRLAKMANILGELYQSERAYVKVNECEELCSCSFNLSPLTGRGDLAATVRGATTTNGHAGCW
jgi:hypothetical protein